MTRLSAVNIPVVVNTRGVDRGVRETESKLAAMQSRLKRQKGALGGLGFAGAGNLAGRLAAGSELLGAGGMAVGGGVAAAFAVSRLVSAINDSAREAAKAMEAVAKGSTTLAQLQMTALAPLAAANAKAAQPKLGTSFFQTLASHGTYSRLETGASMFGAGAAEGVNMLTDWVSQLSRGRIGLPPNFFRRLFVGAIAGGMDEPSGRLFVDELHSLRRDAQTRYSFGLRVPGW